MSDEAPPRNGPGSAKDNWREFLEDNDLEVSDDATREDMIEAAEAEGLIDPDDTDGSDPDSADPEPEPDPDPDPEEDETKVVLKGDLIEHFIPEGSLRLSGRMVRPAGAAVDRDLVAQIKETNKAVDKQLSARHARVTGTDEEE